jgi:hypothetical protein
MVRERVLSGANDVDAGAEQELRDSGVRGAKAWVLRALLAVTSVALLATSPGDEYFYHFEAASEGTVTLTSDEPHASFVVTVRAIALGPDGVDSTRQATSRLQGVITTEGATGRFVSVGVGDGTEPDPDEALEVATEVTLSRSLTFEGNCANPTQGEPCEAQLFVDFERTDGGDGGGAVTLDWVLELESRFHKSDSPSVGPVEAPWTVEVTAR